MVDGASCGAAALKGVRTHGVCKRSVLVHLRHVRLVIRTTHGTVRMTRRFHTCAR